LFAYGQTGSGKTYTMTAIEKLIARDLFEMAREYRKDQDGNLEMSETGDFEIKVSFFEIFGNNTRGNVKQLEGITRRSLMFATLSLIF
jgi:ABC-type dipeptide/oligopeptide/nickel transport system ATPase component